MTLSPRVFRLSHGLDAFPDALRGGAAAIGNFDGVHRGHQAVLAAAREAAQGFGGPSLALTFEPHPRQVFAPDKPLFRLTPPPLKTRLFAALGLSGALVLDFDRALASEDAGDFIDRVLVRTLGVRHVAVGRDFHFGRGRAGTPTFLSDCGRERGFGVTLVDSRDDGGAPISSTRIREALGAGDVRTAADLLGYPWLVEGRVRHGDARGRTLGYPTANIALDPAVGLAHAIYAVSVFARGAWRPAVASFGRRPTFDDGAPLLEVHLFDFAGDLYGETLRVAFIAHIRSELRFDSVEALVRRMDLDSAEARAHLERWGGHPLLDALSGGASA